MKFTESPVNGRPGRRVPETMPLHLPGVPAAHHAGQQVGDGADEAALGGGGEGCERQRQQDQTSHPSSDSGSGFTLSCQWTV